MIARFFTSLVALGLFLGVSSSKGFAAGVATWVPSSATIIPARGGQPGAATGSSKAFFWVDRDSGTFWALDAGSAEPRRLGRSSGFPSSLIADDARLYWVERGHSSTGTLNLNAAAGEQVVSLDATEDPFPIAMVRHDGDGLLASLGRQDGEGAITRLHGDSNEELIEHLRRPIAIAANARHIYWTDAAAKAISRMARAGGKAEVVNENVSAVLLAASDRHLCWAEAGRVVLRDLETGKDVAFKTAGEPRHLSLTAQGVWWVERTETPASSVVMFGPLKGGAAVKMLSGPWETGGLATTDDRALVTLPTESAVVLLSRPNAPPAALTFPAGLVSGRIETLALAQKDAEIIGADSHWLYWRAEEEKTGYLVRVPLTGGTPWRLRLDGGMSDPIVRSDGLAWTDDRHSRLWWSGARESQARVVHERSGIACVGISGAALVATVHAAAQPPEQQDRDSIVRIAPDGGAATEIPFASRDALADGNDVVWTEQDGRIKHVSLAGGQPTALSGPLASPNLLALRDGQVFFSQAHSGAALLQRMAVTGGKPTLVARLASPEIQIVWPYAIAWPNDRRLELVELRTGRIQRVKNERPDFHFQVAADGQAIWRTEDDRIQRAPLTLAAKRDPRRRELIRTLPAALRAWLAAQAKITEDPEPGHFYWSSEVCNHLSSRRLPNLERCLVMPAAGGRALKAVAAYDCGGDSCSTQSWIITSKGETIAARHGLENIDYLPLRNEIIGERIEVAEGGFTNWVIWLYSHSAGVPRPLHAMAPCFSPRVSPGGRSVVCRDKGGNVLRVGPEGGLPVVVHRNLFPEDVPYTPYNGNTPGAVDFLSPSRMLIPDGEFPEFLPWSESDTWDSTSLSP